MEANAEIEIPPLRRKRNKLLFGVRRSVRYHMRRRKFFERLDFWTKFTMVVSGSGTIISVWSDNPHNRLAIIFGAVVAFFAALDLVIGCSGAARDHHDLIRNFSALERQIVAAGSNITENSLNGFEIQRLEIEEDEPPQMRVLNILCHNELVKARGIDKKHLVHVGRLSRWCAQIADIGADKWQKEMEKIEQTKPVV
jgi:hypothetical protein